MSLDARYVLGAAAIAALLASAAYLWRLLRDFPISRRLVNLLMPASQIGLVVCAFALRPFLPSGIRSPPSLCPWALPGRL